MTKTIDATKKDDALAPFQGAGLAVQTDVPEYLRGMAGNTEGNEVGRDDVLIPRLQIAQEGMSPQLKKNNEAYIPGLEPGEFFNTVTGERYGKEVLVVPITFFKNYIRFKPMTDGGGVLAMYDSAADIPAEDLRFGSDNGKSVPPAVTEFKNRLCLLLQKGKKPEGIIVSAKSSNLKAMKKWGSLISSTNLPAYARSYVVKVVHKTKGQQEWDGFDVLPGQFVPQEFFAQAKAYFDKMAEGGFKMDTSGLDAGDKEEGSGDSGF